MKTFNPINSEYTPVVNLDVLNNTFGTLQQNHRKAVEAASQLQASINQIELNDAEAEWKQNKINEVRSIIDNNTEFNNSAGALDDLTYANADILFGPDMIGRIRAQQAYKEFNNKLDKMNIPEAYKDMYRELNPYHYEDKYNDNGQVIEGTKWEPNKNPVNTIPLSDLIVKGISIAAKDAGGSTVTQWLDKNGNVTTNPNEAFDGQIYNTITGKYERLGRDKILKGIKSFIETTPGAKESLRQDWDYAKWNHDKLVNQSENGISIDDATDNNGNLLDENQYLMKRIMPAVEAAEYNHSTTSNSYGNGLATYKAAQMAAANNATRGFDDINNMSISGRNKIIEVQNRNNIDYAGQQSAAFNTVATMFKQLTGAELRNSNPANVGKRINIDHLINKYKIDPVNAKQLKSYIDIYNDCVDNLNIQYNNMNPDDRKYAEFINRLQSGNSFLSSQNGGTKYDDEIIRLKNNTFGNDGVEARIILTSEMRKYVEDTIKAGNVAGLYNLGINFTENNELVVPRDKADLLPLIAKVVNDAEEKANLGAWNTIKDWGNTTFGSYNASNFNMVVLDNQGNIIRNNDNPDKRISYIADDNVLKYGVGNNNTRNLISFANVYNKAMKQNNELNSKYGINPNELYVSTINFDGSNFTEQELFNQFNKGLMDSKTYNARTKYFNDSFEDAVIRNGIYSQAQIYMYDGEIDDNNKFKLNKNYDGIARAIDAEKATTIGNLTKAAFKEGRVTWSPTIIPGTYDNSGKQTYGYNITISPKVDTKGNPIGEPIEYTVVGLGTETAAEMMMAKPEVRAATSTILVGASKQTKILSNSTNTPILGNVTIKGKGNNTFDLNFANIAINNVDADTATKFNIAMEYYKELKNSYDGSGIMNEFQKEVCNYIVNNLTEITNLNTTDVFQLLANDLQYGY